MNSAANASVSRRFVSDQNPNVTASGTNGNNLYETFFDLEPPTDIKFHVLPIQTLRQRGLGEEGQLRLRLFPRDAGGSLLPDDATIRIVGQGPTEESEDQIGYTPQVGEFNNTNQYDADGVWRFNLGDPSQARHFAEDDHLKFQVNSGTALDAGQTEVAVEMVREKVAGRQVA